MQLAAMRAGRSLLQVDDLLSLLASQSPDVQHQAVMYLGKFADSPEVLSQLIAYTTVNASNPISLAGVYAAVAGFEARFATQFFAGGDWSETAEKSSKFVGLILSGA